MKKIKELYTKCYIRSSFKYKNEINLFLGKKIMKDIQEKINEGKFCRLFSEVQSESGKGGEYHTYNFQDGENKFKKGFIYINSSDDFFGIQGLNTSKEFEELIGVEEGFYSELDTLKIGDTTEIDNSTIIRIW